MDLMLGIRTPTLVLVSHSDAIAQSGLDCEQKSRLRAIRTRSPDSWLGDEIALWFPVSP